MKHSITTADIEILKTFEPVEGIWTSSRCHYQIPQDIADEVFQLTGIPVNVELFRENGEHLQGDERNGTMLVTRI